MTSPQLSKEFSEVVSKESDAAVRARRQHRNARRVRPPVFFSPGRTRRATLDPNERFDIVGGNAELCGGSCLFLATAAQVYFEAKITCRGT